MTGKKYVVEMVAPVARIRQCRWSTVGRQHAQTVDGIAAHLLISVSERRHDDRIQRVNEATGSVAHRLQRLGDGADRKRLLCHLTRRPLTNAVHQYYQSIGITDAAVCKKLSYRRGTARCVVSVEILPTATQQCRNYLYEKS